MYFRAGAILIAFLVFAFNWQSTPNYKAAKEKKDADILRIPEGFPSMEFPDDNQFSKDRWELGKKLFYEKRLSIDGSISCASCHLPSLAFTDDETFSTGANRAIGERNAPSLANIGYHPYFMREGAVPTLEMQVLVPIQEKKEFNHNIVLIVKELSADSLYRKMSLTAYDKELDPFVLTRSVAVFERTLISGNSRYDQFVYQGDTTALSKSERLGMDLFFSKRANCSQCHSGFNFTNYSIENNGLDTAYTDLGKMRVSGKEEDEGKFKVPSLRNVALTSPYMHDGRFDRLEQVIEHYNLGGKGHVNQNKAVRFLDLDENEKSDLIAFLKTLTDRQFVNDSRWRDDS